MLYQYKKRHPSVDLTPFLSAPTSHAAPAQPDSSPARTPHSAHGASARPPAPHDNTLRAGSTPWF